MDKKKVLIGIGILALTIATLPLFAAFEAHVINVTARIENALSVDTTPIDFGTVFPQEQIDRTIEIALSQSFLDEPRVDDVEYVIRQKPKCAWTTPDGREVLSETQSGHVDETGEIVCPDPEPADPPETGAVWGPLPLLCPYLSKHPDNTPANDGSLDAFHKIGYVSTSTQSWVWNDVKGRLSKIEQDDTDTWTIDLKVPCFGDHCAQDWDDFVKGVNPNADPEEFVEPIENEHKIFGCDLWIEVGGISLPTGGFGCAEKADVMLVLDRSGSVSGEMTTLKNAAKAFVDALAPSADGVHVGMSSFATTGSLDTHLTDDASAVKSVIDALSSSGTTHLEGGIKLAKGELDNAGDGDDRADAESPDFMVIITDGAPNECDGNNCNPEDAAAAAADAARAAGVEVYVVGVGTDADTTNYLKTRIADDASHYFDASDFSDLEAILATLAECED